MLCCVVLVFHVELSQQISDKSTANQLPLPMKKGKEGPAVAQRCSEEEENDTDTKPKRTVLMGCKKMAALPKKTKNGFPFFHFQRHLHINRKTLISPVSAFASIPPRAG